MAIPTETGVQKFWAGTQFAEDDLTIRTRERRKYIRRAASVTTRNIPVAQSVFFIALTRQIYPTNWIIQVK